MQDTFYRKIQQLWSIKEDYKLKVFLLSFTFLLMTICLVIWRPLKVSIFAKMVGPDLVPEAKLYSLFFLIPLILFYSKLVDTLRRHQLLYCFTLVHALGGIVFYFLLSHPLHGVANTVVDPNRIVGWAFYFFMESFDAFFATSFWAFADSVNNPKDARNFYGYFVSGSKIGGILGAGLLYSLLNYSSIPSNLLLPSSLLFGSCMLIAATLSIAYLIKKVPEGKMHGYEAVYKLEKNKQRHNNSLLGMLKSSFEGFFITIRNAYVLGIFSLVVFYEVVITVFDYIVMIQANKEYETVAALASFYAFYYLMMNLIGLVISLFGTTPILRILGLRLSLFAYPLMTIALLVITAVFPFTWTLIAALIGLRALNYALNHPTREVLYIPTVKDIKFKAKTWTDAFGSRIGKSSGSVFNLSMAKISSSLAIFSSVALSIGLTSICLVITYFLGKKFQHAVDNRKVIGAEENNSEENEKFELEEL